MINNITPAISIEKAYLSFGKEIIFSDLNLVIPSASWTCLLGKSGIGKSSFIRILAQLPIANSTINSVITCSNHQDIKTQLSFMPQQDALFPWLTVLENILIIKKLNPKYKMREKNFAKKILEKLGLEYASNFYPHQLSGGMKQRVSLARILFLDKPIVLLDEPFSSLDVATRYELYDIFFEALKDKTVFFITHDPLEALFLSDKIIIFKNKNVFEEIIPPGNPKRDLHFSDIQKLHLTLMNHLLENRNENIF